MEQDDHGRRGEFALEDGISTVAAAAAGGRTGIELTAGAHQGEEGELPCRCRCSSWIVVCVLGPET